MFGHLFGLIRDIKILKDCLLQKIFLNQLSGPADSNNHNHLRLFTTLV